MARGNGTVEQQLGVLAENMRSGNEARREIMAKVDHLDDCVDRVRSELWELKSDMATTRQLTEKLAPHAELLADFVSDYSWFRKNIVKIALAILAAALAAATGGSAVGGVIKMIFHIG